MSIKVITMTWKLEIEPDEKLVLLAYADHAHDDGTSIFPSVKTVCEMTGYSERSVQYISRKLEKKGLLVYDGRTHRANQWHIPIDDKGAKIAPIEEGSRVQFLTGKVQSETRKVQSVQGKVQPIAPEPLLTVSEPSINRETDSSLKAKDQSKTKEPEPNQPPSKESSTPIPDANSVDTKTALDADALTRAEVNQLFEEKLFINIAFSQKWDSIADLCVSHGKAATNQFLIWWLAHNPEPRYWKSENMVILWPRAFRKSPTAAPMDEDPLKKWEEDPAHPWVKAL